MPQREVERVSDANPVALFLACHVGEAQINWEREVWEWAIRIRNGDVALGLLIDNRIAAGEGYDAFAKRVLELLGVLA